MYRTDPFKHPHLPQHWFCRFLQLVAFKRSQPWMAWLRCFHGQAEQLFEMLDANGDEEVHYSAGMPGISRDALDFWQDMTKHDKTMSLDAASYWSILEYIELVVASFQLSWVFFHEFVDTCSAWIEMAAFSLTFCTFPAKDFLAATVNVRGRWRPLGRKMSSLGTRINSQVGQWSKELSWNYKDKEFYLSYFIVLWLRMWFNYYFNAVYCSQGQGK